MNRRSLYDQFIRLARRMPPSDAVPYAFEKRIMARLAASPVADLWTLWSRYLWRAAAPCVAIMLTLSLWTAFHPEQFSSSDNIDEFETAVLPADVFEVTW